MVLGLGDRGVVGKEGALEVGVGGGLMKTTTWMVRNINMEENYLRLVRAIFIEAWVGTTGRESTKEANVVFFSRCK